MFRFPFLTLAQSLVLLRVATAGIFLTHAVIRLLNGTYIRFGDFLNEKGLVVGQPLVWGITAFELLGGVLLALGCYVRVLSAAFIGLLLVGIGLIHASFGWFVGEHGTGGSEYSVMLIMIFVVLAASSDKRRFA